MKPLFIAQLILFFIKSVKPSKEDQKAATALSKEKGKNVAFRNASRVGSEKPERAIACAGCAPDNYKAAMPFIDAKGKTTDPAPAELEEVEVPEGKDALKQALEDMGVEFHPSTGEEKLIKLFKKSVAEGKTGPDGE